MEPTSSPTAPLDPNAPPQNPPAPAPVEPELVPKEIFDRYKSDVFKYKTKVEALEKELEDKKLQSLKNSQNWEEIAKLKEQEAEEAKQDRDRLKQAVMDREKHSALRQEALKSGINPASIPDLELLDFAEISLETTSQGKIIVHGADKAIQNLKMLRPHWFHSKPTTINPASPETLQSMNGLLSVADIQKLESDYKKNPGPTTEKALRDAIQKFKMQK